MFGVSSVPRAIMWVVMERKDDGKRCYLGQGIGLAECWFMKGGYSRSNVLTGQPRTEW